MSDKQKLSMTVFVLALCFLIVITVDTWRVEGTPITRNSTIKEPLVTATIANHWETTADDYVEIEVDLYQGRDQRSLCGLLGGEYEVCLLRKLDFLRGAALVIESAGNDGLYFGVVGMRAGGIARVDRTLLGPINVHVEPDPRP